MTKEKMPKTWYQVIHTQDYSVQIKEILVIESEYLEDLTLISLFNGSHINQFSEHYTCFPTKDAAIIFIKRRLRNEMKKVQKYLKKLQDQHNIIKNQFN